MSDAVKNIAVIGANKEGLKLLPIILDDKKSRVCLIVDANPDAMLFKLKELGYSLSDKLGIKVSTNLDDVKKQPNLDIIVNALQDQAVERFLESSEFRGVEKLGPLSVRLLWGVRLSSKTAATVSSGQNEHTLLLSSFREIVDAVRLTIDRKELLSVILKLATESIRADRGSIMLISQEEKLLRVEIAKGMDEEVVRKIRVPLGEGVSGMVALTGKGTIISGKAAADEFKRPMERSDVKNSMCVPLLVNRETIGVVNVSTSESVHVFTQDDMSFLTSLASLAAEVIHRSNEYERMRVDSAKFVFWKEVDSIMTSSAPLETRLNKVARRLVEIVPGLTCFIYIYDEDRNRLLLKASSLKDGGKSIGVVSIGPGEGIEACSLDSMKDIVLVERAEEGNTRRTYLSLPMASNGVLVGAFNGQVVSINGLSKYHESFLRDIRTLVSESLYRFRQAEKEKLKSRKMFAVDEAGLEMLSVKDGKMLTTIITTTPAAILGAEGSLLRLKKPGSMTLQTVASYGLDDKTVREYFLPIEKETVTEVSRKKDTVLRGFSETVSPYIRSVISRPLTVNGAFAGILTLFNKSTEGSFYACPFSKSDSDILARFCVYAEKALVNIMPAAEPVKARPVRDEDSSSPLHVFEKIADKEFARARKADEPVIIATVRIAGLKDAFRESRAEFENKLVSFIKKKTRPCDVVIRLNEEIFGFLIPDAGDKVMRQIAALAEAVTGDEVFKKTFMVSGAEILYGYSIYPRDGVTFAELFSKASHRVKLDFSRGIDRR